MSEWAELPAAERGALIVRWQGEANRCGWWLLEAQKAAERSGHTWLQLVQQPVGLPDSEGLRGNFARLKHCIEAAERAMTAALAANDEAAAKR